MAASRTNLGAAFGRARVFVAAPSTRVYGIALSRGASYGCMLVTNPARGRIPAPEHRQQLDLTAGGDDLAPEALALGLDYPADLRRGARPRWSRRSPATPSDQTWRVGTAQDADNIEVP